MKPSNIFHVVANLAFVPLRLIPESDSTGDMLRSIALSQMLLDDNTAGKHYNHAVAKKMKKINKKKLQQAR